MQLSICILQTDILSPIMAQPFGQYPAMIHTLLADSLATKPYKNLEFDHQSYSVTKGEFPSDEDVFDAYCITGSRHSAYESLAWISELEALIRRLHQQQQTIIGLCFGHQIIAQALGGTVAKHDRGWNIGLQATELNDQAKQEKDRLHLIYSHQDQIVAPAPEATVLGSSTNCKYAIANIGHHILSFQGHPEFTVEFAEALYRSREALYQPAQYQHAMRSLSNQHDNQTASRWIIDFILANKANHHQS